MQLEINKLSAAQKNFALAALLGHEWRCRAVLELLEQDGYTRWQGYEKAFGNPTPEYCTDYGVTGKLIDEYLISAYPNFFRDNSGNYDGWYACAKDANKCSVSGMGETRLEAVVACLIKMFATVPNQYVKVEDKFVTIPDQMEGV